MIRNNISTLKDENSEKMIYVVSQPEKGNELLVIHPFNRPDEYLELIKNNKISVVTDRKPEIKLLKNIRHYGLKDFQYGDVN